MNARRIAYPSLRRFARPVLVLLGYTLGWLLLNGVSQIFALPSGVSPWYPPPTLSIALVFCWGRRYLPALFAMPFLADCLVHGVALSVPRDAIYGIITMLGYGGIALVLRDWLKIDQRLRHIRDLVAFFIATTLVASPAVALVATTGGWLNHLVAADDYVRTVMAFWVGDAAGLIVFAPILLVVVIPWVNRDTAQYVERTPMAQRGWIAIEIGAQIASIVIILWVASALEKAVDLDLIYLYFLPTIWVALRRGLPGAAVVVLLTNIGATVALTHVPPDAYNTVNFQLFMLAMSVTGLFVGAAVSERQRVEQALRDSEQRYRTLFDANPQPMWVYDRSSLAFLAVNDAAVKHYGYSRAEFLRYSLKEICVPEDVLALFDHTGKADESVIHAGIWQHIKKDGRRMVADVTTHDLIFDNRKARAALITDVTERKEAEDALRRSDELYRTLARHYPKGSVVLFDSTMRYLVAEGESLEISGFPKSRLEGKTLYEAFPSQAVAYLEPLYRTALSGETVVTETPHAGRYYTAYVLPVRNADGAIFGGMVVTQDITERKEIENALAAEKERLAVTLYSIADGVITTDIHGCVTMLNRVAEQLTGWTQADAIDRPLTDVFTVVDEESRAAMPNPVTDVLQTLTAPATNDFKVLVGRDGTERPIAERGAPIRDAAGKTVGVVLVFRDITDARRAAEERQKAQKLESVGLLAGGIAHDFNNILTAVMGNVALARAEVADNERAQHLLDEAEAAAFRVRGLTQQLLTFSEGGAPIRVTASLAALLREASAFALRGTAVRCLLDIADDIAPVYMDTGQINQVMHNLLINAEQAMPHGGTVFISAANVAGADLDPALNLRAAAYVRVTVRDNGVGIAHSALSRIFDPYFTTKKTGSGLGLATSFSIIAKHDGHIGVTSQPGEGATFTFYLPTSVHGTPPSLSPAAPQQTYTGRILVVDDEPMICTLTRKALERAGHTVAVAADGTEALRLYQAAQTARTPFDAVLLDLTIPGGMGGKETMRELLRADPDVRAIVSSGYSTDPIMADYAAYGFAGVLTKPFKMTELLATVNALLAAPVIV